jgi:hypothetical protein
VTVDAPWGTGRYLDETGSARLVYYPVAEMEREAAAAARRLAAWGVGLDDIVLVVAAVQEAVQFAPFQRAARSLGAISCTAEPSPFDAQRTAAFLEQYPLRAVIGLDGAVLDGLEELGDPVPLLRRCPQLIVRPDAVPRLRSWGLVPARLVILGPVAAIECPARSGAHLGVDCWTVGSSGDQLWVEPTPGRQVDVKRVATGAPGRIIRERCPCGSDDPRVVVV